MSRLQRGLCALVSSFDAIVTSPYTRTSETADIVARAFGGPQPEPVEELTPEARSDSFLEWLSEHDSYDCVAAIGHEPGLSALLALCVSKPAQPFTEFKKGGACMLVWEGRPTAGSATLA